MDFVSDLIGRLQALSPETFSDEMALQFEAQIRADWGGERPYIGKSAGAVGKEISARNRAIIRDYKAGERIPLLARRYGISRVRIWQIIQGR